MKSYLDYFVNIFIINNVSNNGLKLKIHVLNVGWIKMIIIKII
jgi:hypothetical protein